MYKSPLERLEWLFQGRIVTRDGATVIEGQYMPQAFQLRIWGFSIMLVFLCALCSILATAYELLLRGNLSSFTSGILVLAGAGIGSLILSNWLQTVVERTRERQVIRFLRRLMLAD